MVSTKEGTPEVSKDQKNNVDQTVLNNKFTQEPWDNHAAKPDPKPEAKPERMSHLGNSGKEFKTKQAADAWGDSIITSVLSFECGENLLAKKCMVL